MDGGTYPCHRSCPQREERGVWDQRPVPSDTNLDASALLVGQETSKRVSINLKIEANAGIGPLGQRCGVWIASGRCPAAAMRWVMTTWNVM